MNWPVRKLGEVCEINIGRTPSRSNNEYWESGTHHWLSIADMSQGVEITDTKEKITESAVKACNCKIVPASTVLMSFKLSIGKLGINKIPLYTNEAIAALPIKDERILHQRYLLHYLKTVDFARGVDRAAKGLTLNKEKLKQINIALPPLAEQQRIAEQLDTADRILRLREQAIAKLDALERSVFTNMFGHAGVALPKVRLGELAIVKTGRLDANAADVDGAYPFFTCAKTPLRINTFAFDCEAVLIAGNGDLNVKYYAGKFNAYQRTYVVEPKIGSQLEAVYLYCFLDHYLVKLRQMAIGGVIKYIKLNYLTDAEIPLPSLSDQRKFDLIIRSIWAMKKRMMEQKIDGLVASLQHQSFAAN